MSTVSVHKLCSMDTFMLYTWSNCRALDRAMRHAPCGRTRLHFHVIFHSLLRARARVRLMVKQETCSADACACAPCTLANVCMRICLNSHSTFQRSRIPCIYICAKFALGRGGRRGAQVLQKVSAHLVCLF